MTHKEPKFAPKIALYQPDIPQNTASIIRTCSCLGIMLEIIEPCGFIINDRKFKRVVMDYYDAKNIQFYKKNRINFQLHVGLFVAEIILIEILLAIKFLKKFSIWNHLMKKIHLNMNLEVN